MLKFFLSIAIPAFAAVLPLGRIVDRVSCTANSSQTYALYLPSNYSAQRSWPVIFAFDPRARGRVPVERYQPAAEKYGYVIAGSNNSQNGSWAVSMGAAQAMVADAGSRFAIDARRVYTAGMSGGARVAMGVALASNLIAGVIASSAGFPDSQPRKSVPFAVFGTAGTEDFNYLEMRRLDRTLTSPHRLAVFPGSHVWLSSELATEAIEWMELQAMKSGRRPRDNALIEEIYQRRKSAIDAMAPDKDMLASLEALVADLEGLKDVSQFAARAAELRRDKHIRDAIKKDRTDEDTEQRQIAEILGLEAELSSSDRRRNALMELRSRWKKLVADGNGSEDRLERRMARRIARGLLSGAADRVSEPEYLGLLNDTRRQIVPPQP